ILGAALGLMGAYAGCTAIEALDGLQFDRGAGGGSGGGDADADFADANDADANDADANDADANDADANDADANDASCAPAGYACGAPPPSGWAGPIAVYEGPPGTAPVCPNDYPTPALDGGTGLDAA